MIFQKEVEFPIAAEVKTKNLLRQMLRKNPVYRVDISGVLELLNSLN